ncbi:MAG: ImmA/IrrE family metallo-endopeptidase [Bifidobacterium sp.]
MPESISMRITYGELRRIAASLGVRVWSRDLDDETAGYYDDVYDAIIIDRTMTYREKRCAMLHELIHWAHADSSCGWLTDTKMELRTRRETATRLISPSEYALAEYEYDGIPYSIAEELDVTMQVVRDFQKLVVGV